MEDQPRDPIGVVDDRYALLRELGPGRRAKTWYGHDRHKDRPVIVKQLQLGEAPDWKAVELFEREVDALRNLTLDQTPNYLEHITPGEDDEDLDFYLVYAYVEGDDLQTLLDQGERFEPEEVRETTRELLGILADLHRREPPIVHRDVKPSNIVRRPDGSLALIDFGAVQLVRRETVGGSTIIGTTGYLPPEQLMGRAMPASDLYGIGATAVHLASGRHPNDLPAERNRLQFHDHVDLPGDFRRFLDRLLAPAPEDRFADAGEALEVLESDTLDAGLPHKMSRLVSSNTGRGMLVAAAVLLGAAALVTTGGLPPSAGGEDEESSSPRNRETSPPPEDPPSAPAPDDDGLLSCPVDDEILENAHFREDFQQSGSSRWQLESSGNASSEIADGRLHLEIFRCAEATATIDLGELHDPQVLNFDWRSRAEQWHEWIVWSVSVDGEIVAEGGNHTGDEHRVEECPGTEFKIRRSTTRSGTLTARIPTGGDVRLRFAVLPSNYCQNGDHGTTELWVDNLRLADPPSP